MRQPKPFGGGRAGAEKVDLLPQSGIQQHLLSMLDGEIEGGRSRRANGLGGSGRMIEVLMVESSRRR
jgi:hypothetical protein